MFRYKVISYLVDGYRNTAAHEAKLDSFICASWDSTWADYAECVIPIHKKSRHINNENIKKNPHDYYDYPDESEYVYFYRWSKGIGLTKTVRKGNLYFDGVLCKEQR